MSLRDSRSTVVALVTFATFADIVAYSIAVPVLPDLTRRLGASPTMIGLLFGSFGVTLLTVSIPMGAVSDRVGRRGPMVGGLAALAVSTLLFAFSDGLAWLFAARLVQGAADAITWVVGFALLADLYGPEERGRVTGIVMSGTTFAFIIGPSIGGWLYEIGGPRLPFLIVVALAAIAAASFLWIDLPRERRVREPVRLGAILGAPTVIACALAVVLAAATHTMLEPVLALHLSSLGVGPGRVGIVFGVGAVASASLHPLFGRLTDRWGARRMTLWGLGSASVAVALISLSWSFASTLWLFALTAATGALMITPSLTYMAEAVSAAGTGSFGVAYGIYNMAWGVGLLGGPVVGGFWYERLGFSRLTLAWAPALLAVTWLLARVQSSRSPAGVSKEPL